MFKNSDKYFELTLKVTLQMTHKSTNGDKEIKNLRNKIQNEDETTIDHKNLRRKIQEDDETIDGIDIPTYVISLIYFNLIKTVSTKKVALQTNAIENIRDDYKKFEITTTYVVSILLLLIYFQYKLEIPTCEDDVYEKTIENEIINFESNFYENDDTLNTDEMKKKRDIKNKFKNILERQKEEKINISQFYVEVTKIPKKDFPEFQNNSVLHSTEKYYYKILNIIYIYEEKEEENVIPLQKIFNYYNNIFNLQLKIEQRIKYYNHVGMTSDEINKLNAIGTYIEKYNYKTINSKSTHKNIVVESEYFEKIKDNMNVFQCIFDSKSLFYIDEKIVSSIFQESNRMNRISLDNVKDYYSKQKEKYNQSFDSDMILQAVKKSLFINVCVA